MKRTREFESGEQTLSRKKSKENDNLIIKSIISSKSHSKENYQANDVSIRDKRKQFFKDIENNNEKQITLRVQYKNLKNLEASQFPQSKMKKSMLPSPKPVKRRSLQPYNYDKNQFKRQVYDYDGLSKAWNNCFFKKHIKLNNFENLKSNQSQQSNTNHQQKITKNIQNQQITQLNPAQNKFFTSRQIMADSLSNLDISHLISKNDMNIIYKNSFINQSKLFMNTKNDFQEYSKRMKIEQKKPKIKEIKTGTLSESFIQAYQKQNKIYQNTQYDMVNLQSASTENMLTENDEYSPVETSQNQFNFAFQKDQNTRYQIDSKQTFNHNQSNYQNFTNNLNPQNKIESKQTIKSVKIDQLNEIYKDQKYAVDRSFNNSKVNKFHLNHEYLSKKIQKNKILKSDLGILKVNKEANQDILEDIAFSEQVQNNNKKFSQQTQILESNFDQDINSDVKIKDEDFFKDKVYSNQDIAEKNNIFEKKISIINNEEQRIVCKTREEPRKNNLFKNKNILMQRNIILNKNSNNDSQVRLNTQNQNLRNTICIQSQAFVKGGDRQEGFSSETMHTNLVTDKEEVFNVTNNFNRNIDIYQIKYHKPKLEKFYEQQLLNLNKIVFQGPNRNLLNSSKTLYQSNHSYKIKGQALQLQQSPKENKTVRSPIQQAYSSVSQIKESLFQRTQSFRQNPDYLQVPILPQEVKQRNLNAYQYRDFLKKRQNLIHQKYSLHCQSTIQDLQTANQNYYNLLCHQKQEKEERKMREQSETNRYKNLFLQQSKQRDSLQSLSDKFVQFRCELKKIRQNRNNLKSTDQSVKSQVSSSQVKSSVKNLKFE